jgi:chemotaxis protein histidine kinase CheA
MAEIESTTTGVTESADHEVIVVPNRLKKAVRHAGADDRDPIADAEEALLELSVQFGSWMEDECTQLDNARQLVNAEGFTEAARQTLFRAAHDIKGHGATFGFPMAADVADSLCRLIEHCSDLSHVPLAFIDQCVDSVRAIIREHDRIDAGRTAAELANGLRSIANELIGGTSGGSAPVETAASPPLVPAKDADLVERFENSNHIRHSKQPRFRPKGAPDRLHGIGRLATTG